MNTDVVRTIDVSYTAPELPTPLVRRPHLVQTLLQLFESNTDVVCVEAAAGYGKTTLLLEFASTSSSPCFATFLKPSSRLSYDPVLVRSDLANQVHWFLKSTRLPDDKEPTDGELRTLWNRCARQLHRQRNHGYIVIDGLHHIPVDEEPIRLAILDLLPIGVKPFRFLFSGNTDGMPSVQDKILHVKPYPMSTFAFHESDEYLKDVVPDRDVRTRYHSALGGIPSLLASIRRQIAMAKNGDDEIDIESATHPESLFEAEWNLVGNISEDTKSALAVLIAFGYPVPAEPISRFCQMSVPELEAEFSSLPFLTFSTKAGGWEFSAETFRQFVEEKLGARVRSATEQLVRNLLQSPDSHESLTHLPLYLEKTGNTDTLLEWLHEGRLASILHKTRTTAGLEPTLTNAISVSHSGKNDGALATYSLARSAVHQLAQTTGMEDEIRARSALGDVDGALSVANDVPLITHRLRLLAVCADSLAKLPGFAVQSLLDEIRAIFGTLDIATLPTEEAIDLATDLYAIDPRMALDLLKESVNGEVEEQTFEMAIARVSLSALQSKAAMGPEAETATHHPVPKELIVDKKLHRLLKTSTIFFGEKTAREVLDATSLIDDVSARLFIQRKWISSHPFNEDTLDVVECALRDAISESDFVPTATFYREVATSLPYATDHKRRNNLIAVIDGQQPIFSKKGPTVDVVRLQLHLARCSFQVGNLERTASRLDETYLDSVEPVDELETRIACLGWFIAELQDFDCGDELVQFTRIKTLVEEEFDKTLAEILENGADQYLIVEEALRALALHKPRLAIDVSRRLNTIDRRNTAYFHIIVTMCRTKSKKPNGKIILEILDMMAVGVEKDDAIEAFAIRLSEDFEKGPELVDLLTALLSEVDHCFSSVIKVECLAAFLIALEGCNDVGVLESKIQQAVAYEFEGVDSPGIRYWAACKLINKLRNNCPELAKTLLGYLSEVENRTAISENVEQGLYFLSDLLARGAHALARAGLLKNHDVERICSTFSKVQDGYRKVSVLATFTFYLWCEEQVWCFSEVVNSELWPALNDLNVRDHATVYKAWRVAYPVVWLDDRDRARAAIANFPSEARNECTSALIFSLLNRQPFGEPFDHAGTKKEFLSYSNVQNLLQLCEETDEDNVIFIVFERIADEVSGRKGRLNITRDQRADIARRMLEIAETQLPIPYRIQHAGYQILCKAQALRIHEPKKPTWNEIVADGEALGNAADRAYVLTYLASWLPTNRKGRRDRLYRAADEATDNLKSTEDRYHRFFTIAEVSAEKNKALASKALRKAFESVVHTTGRRSAVREHQLVDLAYRVDPELPMKFAMLHDDDPAREEYRDRARKQIGRHQLKIDIGDSRSRLDLNSQRNNPNLASAAWNAIGGLNSGRLIATDIIRLRDMLVCASNFPLHTSYPMYSWVLTNVMMKYGETTDAQKYIRDMFEGFLRGAEFYFLVVAGESELSERPKWQEMGDDGTHILIHRGEREKALSYIKEWTRAHAEEYLVVVDPYFGPEELEFLVQVMDIDPYLRVRILTGKRHHQGYRDGLPNVYSAAWRDLCDQTPPETEVLVIGTEGTGNAPFHDRWILSKEVGLRLGTSFNSLGSRDSEISFLSSSEVSRIQNTVDRYLAKQVREIDGERVRYESFELWC